MILSRSNKRTSESSHDDNNDYQYNSRNILLRSTSDRRKNGLVFNLMKKCRLTANTSTNNNNSDDCNNKKTSPLGFFNLGSNSTSKENDSQRIVHFSCFVRVCEFDRYTEEEKDKVYYSYPEINQIQARHTELIQLLSSNLLNDEMEESIQGVRTTAEMQTTFVARRVILNTLRNYNRNRSYQVDTFNSYFCESEVIQSINKTNYDCARARALEAEKEAIEIYTEQQQTETD